MANVVLPTIIQGPAYITHGGVAVWVQGDIVVEHNVETWNPASALGPLGERFKARTYRVTATPVGQVNSTLMNYFYAVHLAPTGYVGKSIIPAANDNLVINDIHNLKTYTLHRAGISQPPSLILKSNGTAFGAMEWTAIIDAATQPTAAAAYRTNAGVLGSVDTTFEESEMIVDNYSAAIGARATPYDAIGALDGFEFNFGFETRPIEAGDVGVADVILTGVSAGGSFIPSNLTEAQVDTLIAVQDSTAILPGQLLSRGTSGTPENLVVTTTQRSPAFTFTLYRAGFRGDGRVYEAGQHRLRAVGVTSHRGWTAGAETALIAYTLT